MRQLPLAFLFAILAAGPGTCQNPDGAQVTEERAAGAYGDAHPDCLEWSDGCVVCARAAGLPACSTPGIACQPRAAACKTAAPAEAK